MRFLPKYILFAAIFFLTVTVAHAQTVPTKTVSGRNELTLQNNASTAGQVADDTKLKANIGIVLDRVQEAVVRIDDISQRITLRLSKMPPSVKTAKLNSLVTTSNTQISKLKADFKVMQDLTVKLTNSKDLKKDYPAFKKQVQTIDSLLQEIVTMQKNIISSLASVTPVAATVSPTVVKK